MIRFRILKCHFVISAFQGRAVLLSFELNRTLESKLPYTFWNRILISASSCLIQQKPKPSPLALPLKVYKAISLNEKRLFRSNRYQRPQQGSNGHCVILTATEYFTKWQKRLLARLRGTIPNRLLRG